MKHTRSPGPALAVTLAVVSLASCTAAQWKAVEAPLVHLACELVGVLLHDEQVGTLCAGIAPAVEEELARRVAQEAPAGALLAHRHRRHSRPVRVAEHIAGRDPRDGETMEPEYLDAVRRVLARQAASESRGAR